MTEEPCAAEAAPKFAVGDAVTYKNEYGVRFAKTVTGHFRRSGDGVLYAMGYRYLLDSDSWWMPVREEDLSARQG